MKFLRILTSLALFCVLSACGKKSGDAPSKTFVSIGTGSQTGVYYPVGNAIKKVAEATEGNTLRVSVSTSQGSVYNINSVLKGSLQFGVAQADREYQAVNGLGAWEGTKQTDLRSVFSLHQEVINLVASEASGIQTLTDLKGKTVNIGSPGSGQRGNAEDILGALGLDLETDIQAESLTAKECASMLQDGRIDAYFYTVGHPNGSLLEASNGKRPVRFVPVTGMDALIEASPFYVETTVPTDLYPKALAATPVKTIGMTTSFLSSATVDDETVYQLVKSVFSNLESFKSQHPALARLTPEGMLKGLNAPLHPGAERYYKEAGLL